MEKYFISDLHFQHNLVSKQRGFSTPEQHDLKLIQSINSIVKDTDELYILGDITFNANQQSWQENLKLVDLLNGTKHLISGNHDRCAPNNSNAHLYKQEFLKHFESVSEFIRLSHNGKRIMLSHYPYSEENYSQYALKDEGHVVIHGHTHSNNVLTFSNNGTPQINVNVESIGMKPKTLHELNHLFNSRKRTSMP